MNWSVSVATGLWLFSLVDGAFEFWVLWVALAAPSLWLSANSWKQAVPMMLAGWVVAWCWTPRDEPPRNAGQSMVHVTLEPRFVPGVATLSDSVSIRGHCHLGNKDVQGEAWTTFPNSVKGIVGEAWVRLAPVDSSSDLSASFDWAAYLRDNGMAWEATVLPPLEVDAPYRFTLVHRVATWWRAFVHERLKLIEHRPLMLGIFAGDRSLLQRETRMLFAEFGLSHILAVSGYHVGLVSGLFLLFLKAQNRWIKRLSVLGIAMAWCFVMLCGMPVSAIRAAIMMTLGWWGWVRGCRVNVWHAWGMAACIAWLLDPNCPNELGCQLSFAATAGLIGTRKLTFWNIPLVAQWSTLPWSISVFQGVSWLFWPANLLVGLWLMVLGFMMAALLVQGDGIVVPMNWWVDLFVDLIHWSQKTLPNWNLGDWMNGQASMHFVLAAWLLLLFRFLHDDRRRLILMRCLGLASLLVFISSWGGMTSADLSPPVLMAVRSQTPCFLVHNGRCGLGWYEREEEKDVIEHAAKNLGLQTPIPVVSLDKSLTNEWAHPPLEVWTHSWIPWQPTQRIPTASKSINSISKGW